MKTVRKILLICIVSFMSLMYCATDNKVCAQAYYEIDVELGYDNQAKYGRYIPVEAVVYSEEAFVGTISVQRSIAGGATHIQTYPIEVEEYGVQTIQSWVPLFEKGEEFEFVLKNSAGEEVKRVKESINVLDSDYTELFVGVIDERGTAKRLFDKINLGEYTSTTFPYILTRTFSLETSKLRGEVEYILDCLDIIIVMEDAMQLLTDENVEAIMEWVEDGHTLIIDYSTNVKGKWMQYYYKAYVARQEEDELSPGLWMPDLEYGEGSISFFDSHLEGNLNSYAVSNQKNIGNIICKACSLEYINSIIDYDMYYANYDDSYEVRYMLNSAIGKPVPDIKNYIMVIAVYILLVGPVLYLLLRKKGRVRYMLLIIVLISGAFSYGIYKMGSNTRFTDMFFQYANIVNITEADVREKTYICANVPYKDTYYMKVPSDYTIMPLTELQNGKEASLLTAESEEYIEFVHSDEDTKIILKNEVPFSREYLEAERVSSADGVWQIDVDITYYDNVVIGKVTNNSNKNFEQMALIMYGKLMLLGELKSGEQINLDSAKVVTLPYYPNDVAERVTGLDMLSEDTNEPESIGLYEELNSKAGIFEYVVDKYFDEKNTNAVLIGFTDDEEETFKLDDRYEAFGFTMIYKEVEVNTVIGNLKYEPLHYSAVTNVDNTGSYDAYSNTTYGSRVRLEYFFEDKESLASIIFNGGDDEDDYYGPFTGVTYFYNYETMVYDEVDISQEYFYVSDMEDYLVETGNGYTLMVQYSIRATGQYRYTEIKLPNVAVVRRIADVKNTEPKKELR